jgi:hypothetical protein
MPMLSVFQGVGPLMIDVMLFLNCFALMMIRNRPPSLARSASLPKNQNENARHSLREIQTLTKRKQFRGLHDLQSRLNLMTTNPRLVDYWVEHLVKNPKTKSKSHAVFI